jgi:uncharacterized protein (DUF433 family)
MLPDSPYLDRIGPDAMRIKGTRVGLEHLISAYNEGYTAEELAMQYRTVALEQIHGVLAYYLANKTAVDEYLRICVQQADALRLELERRPVPEVVSRLRQIAAAREARSSQ